MEQLGQNALGDLNAAVAAEIRAILARRRWRQTQLAERLGVHEMWVSRRLRGVNAITVDDLERIADALGMKPVELLGLAEQAGTQMNSRFPAAPERPPGNSLAPARRPVDNRPDGRPISGGRRPERVARHPIAA
jgi:transcriptional regulator with XRE-family HTH domain